MKREICILFKFEKYTYGTVLKEIEYSFIHDKDEFVIYHNKTNTFLNNKEAVCYHLDLEKNHYPLLTINVIEHLHGNTLKVKKYRLTIESNYEDNQNTYKDLQKHQINKLIKEKIKKAIKDNL